LPWKGSLRSSLPYDKEGRKRQVNVLLFHISRLGVIGNAFFDYTSTFFFTSRINLSAQLVFLSLLQNIGLIIACVACSAIFIYSEGEVLGLQQRQRMQDRNLAKTLFIVTSLSVMTWFPHAVINAYRYIGFYILPNGAKKGDLYRTGQIFRLAYKLVYQRDSLLMKTSFKNERIELH